MARYGLKTCYQKLYPDVEYTLMGIPQRYALEDQSLRYAITLSASSGQLSKNKVLQYVCTIFVSVVAYLLGNQSRPILYVCHSLGGIVAKQVSVPEQ
jgi:triacylglycerol esterase/lipase EstA (alpha/beta hydrolase family)